MNMENLWFEMTHMELPAYFNIFLQNIEPTTNQKQEASTGHTTCRTRLSTDKDYCKYFCDSFLSGSYGRQTSVRPINDVDIIIITNHSEFSTPNTVQNLLVNILKKYYNSTCIRMQGRSVRISLSYVTMDIVPTITINGKYGALKIPDRNMGKWVLTNPRKHLELASNMNAKNNNLYKPLVKALKEWNNNRIPANNRPKSFILECMIYYYVLENGITSIPKAIEGFFWKTNTKYAKDPSGVKCSPIIRDPAGTGNDVAKKWSYDDFCVFRNELFSSWATAYRALKAEGVYDSVTEWRKLLGSKFPTQI